MSKTRESKRSDKSAAIAMSKASLPKARARYLAQSIELEERDVPGAVTGIIAIAIGLICGAVIWSAVTSVKEVATAEGEVIPAGLNYRVQHLEGGLVDAMYVANGDRVEKGQVLIKLQRLNSESEQHRVRTRLAALKLERERLLALIEERPPRFGQDGKAYPEIASRHHAAYEAQRLSQISQVSLAQARVEQRKAELRLQERQIKTRRDEIEILAEQLQIRTSLAEQGAFSKDDLLTIRAKILDREGQLTAAEDSVTVAKDALEEAERHVHDVSSRLREELQLRGSELSSEIAETDAQLVRLEDQVRRTDLRAPAKGIVQGLTVNSIGAVIEPGATLLEVIPIDDRMVVESRITTRDIGHVRAGQPVDIKVSAYDPARFGTISGTLEKVSPSTYLDEQGNPFYKGEIALSTNHLGSDETKHQIIPGMTVKADIITGERTILDYLLNPVFRAFSNALSER